MIITQGLSGNLITDGYSISSGYIGMVGSGTGTAIKGYNQSQIPIISINQVPQVVVTSSSSYTTISDSYVQQIIGSSINNNIQLLPNIPLNYQQNYSFTSLTPSISTINSSGVTDWVSDGLSSLTTTTKIGTILTKYNTSQYSGTVDVFKNFVSGSLGLAACTSIDSAISGKTPSTTTQDLLSGSIRNTSLFTAIDMTAVSTSNPGAIAVSPLHVIVADHNLPTSITFLDNSGVSYTRTPTSTTPISGTDIAIGLLNSALPSAITPASVLPADYLTYLPGFSNGVACIFNNSKNELYVGEASATGNGKLLLNYPFITTRQAWYKQPAFEDSGCAVCLVVSNTLVLLNALHYGFGGDMISDNISAINAIMTTNGYTLNQIVLTSFTAY